MAAGSITYFGILVSDCKVVIQEPDVDVLVVEDHALGTNDCRGWISERLFGKLNLPDHRFYQFRLGFYLDKGALALTNDGARFNSLGSVLDWAGEHDFEFVAKCEPEGSARVATEMRRNGGRI